MSPKVKYPLRGLQGKKITLRHFFENRYGTSLWPLICGFGTLAVIFAAGTFLYMYIEGWDLLESFFMVIITLSTVGYQEIYPLSDKGILLTSALILLGVGNFAFLIGTFTQMLIEGSIQTAWGKLKVQKIITKLSKHVIICGYGRIGSIAAAELMREGMSVVVVEQDHEKEDAMEEAGVYYVIGDATFDETLSRANIEQASYLIAAMHSETANVYVSLAAKQLNPDIQVVSRSRDPKHIARLKQAGADQVLLPYTLGGIRIAQSIVRPTVTSFLELAQSGGGIDLSLEELTLSPASSFCGKNLMESKIRQQFNVIIIALKRTDKTFQFNPAAETELIAGDVLVAVGDEESLTALAKKTGS